MSETPSGEDYEPTPLPGLFQYCVEAGCNYTAHWRGGSAAHDPAIEHLKNNHDHTVRSGAHIGHYRLMKLQSQGKADHDRSVDPEKYRGEQWAEEVQDAE